MKASIVDLPASFGPWTIVRAGGRSPTVQSANSPKPSMCQPVILIGHPPGAQGPCWRLRLSGQAQRVWKRHAEGFELTRPQVGQCCFDEISPCLAVGYELVGQGEQLGSEVVAPADRLKVERLLVVLSTTGSHQTKGSRSAASSRELPEQAVQRVLAVPGQRAVAPSRQGPVSVSQTGPQRTPGAPAPGFQGRLELGEVSELADVDHEAFEADAVERDELRRVREAGR